MTNKVTFKNMQVVLTINDTDVYQNADTDEIVIVTHGYENGSLDLGLDMAIMAIEEMGWQGSLKDLNILCCYPNQVRYAEGQVYTVHGEWNTETDFIALPTNNEETVFTLIARAA